MDDRSFEQRFLLHVEPLSEAQAWAALEAALDVLGEALDTHGARGVADLLPPRLREPLLRRKGPQQLGREDVDRHMARELGLPEGRAREHRQIVLEALVRVVDPACIGRFRRELGEPLDALLQPAPTASEVPRPAGHERTLAGGRAGGQRPLSEGRPPGSQAHSVREANPHGDTKISSSPGTTQEREQETLAEGKDPGR